MEKNEQSRRQFISSLALGAVGTLGAGSIFASCANTGSLHQIKSDTSLSLRDLAPDGRTLRAGLVGCGSRGTGAAINFIDAAPNLEIVALGDVFKDQLYKCRSNLKQARRIEVADTNCYTGFDNYQKVIETAGVDVVLFATPPHFRPMHVKAAIEAGKHVFQEKPVAVDPVGARIIDEVIQKAKANSLCMVSGTQGRYAKDSLETQRRVANGEIGEVVSASIIRNHGAMWWVERKPEWSDMEYMLRNWGNFSWLSGDHIVEMFIHQLDAMSWYFGSHPQKAIGYGSRLQRISGDQFDQFSIVYEYENSKKAHCATRLVNGLDSRMEEIITGTKGYAAHRDSALYHLNGDPIWKYPYPSDNDPDQTWKVNPSMVQEHVELITAIRTGNYLNDSEEQIKSSRIAIMGRMAAYTGREITWEEVLNSDLRLGPDTYEFGPVDGISEKPPVVGKPASPTNRYDG